MKARLVGITLGLCLAIASPAAASTFCVPTFHSACPNAGGNVAMASLEAALTTDASDGIADRILIAPGTITDPDTINDGSGTDGLEIVGAGPGQTLLTSSDNGNQFVVNLDGDRPIVVADLTIVVPASFPDGLGGALQAEQDEFLNVDIESRNPGSDGAASMIGGGVFRDGRIYGAAGGSIGDGVGTNGASTGTLTVERTAIEGPSWGFALHASQVVTFARRVTITDPVAYGMRVSDGAFAVLENSVIEVDDAYPVSLAADTSGTVIFTGRHLTLIDRGGAANAAIDAQVQTPPGNGSVQAVVQDSIMRGFASSYVRNSPSLGSANLTIRHSNFPNIGTSTGIGTLSLANNVDADPLFAGAADFHLLPGSPSIDSGDPATAVLPAEDLDGMPRPVDGNGDGVAQRDMGAYEYLPPATQPVKKKKKCKKKRKAKRRADAAKKRKCKRKRKRR